MPGERYELIATTAFGLESVVVRELDELGYRGKPVSTGRVVFEGDGEAICRSNLWLRAADRVLLCLGRFPARDFGALFDGVRGLAWEQWIGPSDAFPVSGRSVKSQLSSVPACQAISKKAIVERLRAAHRVSELPEVGTPVAVEVSLLNDEAILTIDTSGVGLHKRGYRSAIVGEASLKETMAAGLVLLSVWDGEDGRRPLVDPFCGTGTIVIEAALIARNIAPGIARTFDAERWLGGAAVPARLWEEARQEARELILPPLKRAIHGTDIDERALAMARANARAAGEEGSGVEKDVHFAPRDFRVLSSKLDYGCIVTNPPYGVRLLDTGGGGHEEAELRGLYREMPRVLRNLPTWSFHILTARLDLEDLFGQPATTRRKLYNSKIECTYFSFLGPKPPWMSKSPAGNVPDAVDGGDAPEHDPQEIGASEFAVNKMEAEWDEHELLSDTRPGSEGVQEPVGNGDGGGQEPQEHVRLSDIPAFGGLRERDVKEAGELAACVRNNLRQLRKYPSRGITCYRIYERDVPDVPLIVDRYEDCLHVSEYERRHSRTPAQQADWFDLMRATLAETVGVMPANVYMKEKHRQRAGAFAGGGREQFDKLGDARHTRIVHEGGLKFEVNLSDYVDTGLFLDHRLTRAMVREQSAGKRVLNLFSYTGSFSVYAGAGGAEHVTSVDLSNTYLSWAERNLELNGLWNDRQTLVRADVSEFLRTHETPPETGHGAPRSGWYDLAIVDPPTFSNSSSTEEDWEVAGSHADLLRALTPLMSAGGVIYFSTNYRRFKLDEGAISELGLSVREISARTVPPEYRNRRIHRCWRMVVGRRAEPSSGTP